MKKWQCETAGCDAKESSSRCDRYCAKHHRIFCMRKPTKKEIAGMNFGELIELDLQPKKKKRRS